MSINRLSFIVFIVSNFRWISRTQIISGFQAVLHKGLLEMESISLQYTDRTDVRQEGERSYTLQSEPFPISCRNSLKDAVAAPFPHSSCSKTQ